MNINDILPEPRYRIVAARRISASPDVVWNELLSIPMASLPIGRTLIRIRHLPAVLVGRERKLDPRQTFLDVTPIPVVHMEPGRRVISAGPSQPWRLLGGAPPPSLDAAAFRGWSEPGWVKVAMQFLLEESEGGTLLSTETRISVTDPDTARVFGAYWFAIRSSSSLIRREVIRRVAYKAEGPSRRRIRRAHR